MQQSDADNSERGQIAGQVFERGEGAHREAFVVRTVDGSLSVLVDGQKAFDAPLEHVRVSARVGRVARRLEFPDGSVFQTMDNDAVDSIVLGQRSKGAVAWLETPHPRLIIVALAALLLIWGTLRYGVPVLAAGAVAITPDAYSRVLAQGTLKTMDATLLGESKLDAASKDPVVEQFGDLVTAYGVRYPDKQDRSFTLLFRNAPSIGPNAFALPDGTIVITDQMVRFTSDATKLAGVLAHEIGHVHYQHSLHQIYRSAGVAALILFVSGDLSELTEDLLVQGSALLALSHSRGMEAQSDEFSVNLMRDAGKDPNGIAAFFEQLLESCKHYDDTSWLSTHPGLSDRIETIKRLAADE